MSIRELINSIKIRPKMFVAEVQLDYIFHFLLGYLGAEKHNASEEERELCSIYAGRFVHWVHKSVNTNSSNPIEFDFIWYRMIEKVTNSEQEAAELFFKLSEEFFNYYEKSEEKKS